MDIHISIIPNFPQYVHFQSCQQARIPRKSRKSGFPVSTNVTFGNHICSFTSMIIQVFLVSQSYLLLQMPMKCQFTVTNIFTFGNHILSFASMTTYAFYVWKA